MKILLVLALAAFALAAQAQTVTNLVISFTVETGTVGGSTNSVVTSVRWDYGVPNKQIMIAGLVYAWNQYKLAGGTNTLGEWLKTDVKDRAKSYADAKAQVDYANLVSKLTSLLLQNQDLLSASDLSSLNTIAAKAP